MRSGFYIYTEQTSGCVGSQVGWLLVLFIARAAAI